MIRCIAIDDEPPALRQIERYIARIPELELIGTYYSADEAKRTIDKGNIDVIFLDIEMPDINGVEFARRLGPESPYIIFTTAYPQYAVDGFRLDAVDYLLKPLAFDELLAAVDKLKRRRMASTEPNKKKHLFVKASGSMHKVAIDDILYIKGLSEYVQIWLRDANSPLTTYGSLKNYEDELSQFSFMRLHKSFLVNLNAIDSATRTNVTIAGVAIPIGEKYRTSFSAYLKSKTSF